MPRLVAAIPTQELAIAAITIPAAETVAIIQAVEVAAAIQAVEVAAVIQEAALVLEVAAKFQRISSSYRV